MGTSFINCDIRAPAFQQHEPPPQQLGSVPVKAPVMIPVAQPTPALTVIAPKGQLRAQAPHSMHALMSRMRAVLPENSRTLCGHT